MNGRKYFLVVLMIVCTSCILPVHKDSVVTLTIINKTAETICVNTGIYTSILSDGIRKIAAFKTETITVKKETAVSVYSDTTGMLYGVKMFRQSGEIWIIT
ncbi:MAG: hypothetical protein ACTTH7_09390 [Treponema sp.]